MALWSCRCGSLNRGADTACRACATPKGKTPAALAPAGAPGFQGTCPHDGAALIEGGFCPQAGGYPFGPACPFACPICRGKLDWTGGCYACHGTTRFGRHTWTFPGDRYDRHDEHGEPLGDGRHWVLTVKGPRECIGAEEAQEVARLAGRIFSAAPTTTTTEAA